MYQVKYSDSGKLHVVTFSGDEAKKWMEKFLSILIKERLDHSWKDISATSEV